MGSSITIGWLYRIKNRPVLTKEFDIRTGKVAVTYPNSSKVYWVWPSTLNKY